ncbi:MAG: DUF58 domain-containing protein [Verrucomicrobiota bacterium]
MTQGAVMDDLLDKHVRRLQLTSRKAVIELLAGEYHSVFKGRGIEFEEVREYQPGDDVRTIDWNVTARTGKPFIKQYIEERELTIFLMVDMSASFTAGSVGEAKREAAAELCTLIAHAAIRNNDRVGLILFTGEVESYLPPGKSESHIRRLAHDLLAHQPEQTGTDVGKALDFMEKIHRRRCIVFLFSDFQSPAFEEPLSIVRRYHDLIAVSVTDPHETELPPAGLVRLRDNETGVFRVIDTASKKIRRRLKREAEARREALNHRFSDLDVDHLAVLTHEDYVNDLVHFFEARKKGARGA